MRSHPLPRCLECLFMLFVATLLGPSEGLAADLAQIPQTVWSDGLGLATAPVTWESRDWLILLGVVAGGVGVYQKDAAILKAVHAHENRGLEILSEGGNAVGDPRLLLPLLAGTAATGYTTGNDELLTTAGLATESLVFSGAMAEVIKAATARSRPSAGQGPHNFDRPGLSLPSDNSFPSGHTSSAFAVAGVLAARYPGTPVAYGALGAAALTGYARIEKDRHWASDVYTGAAIGLWTGLTIAGRHQASRAAAAAGRPTLALLPRQGGAELRLVWMAH